MEWHLLLEENEKTNQYNFEIGICNYVPNNGIDWLDVKGLKGIENFKALAERIL
jgi:hypothetical protein